MPVLRDGDETIWDSLAICEVKNERYLDGKAWHVDAHPKLTRLAG